MAAHDVRTGPMFLDGTTESDRQVVITPADQDRFVKTVGEIISRLQKDRAIEEGQRAIRERTAALFVRLSGWIVAKREYVASAWLTQRDSRMLFLVVSKEIAYDPSLSSSLIDLDLAIADDEETRELSIGVLLIPNVGEHPERCFLSSVGNRIKLL